MSLQEYKTVINDIINDYNLDILLLVVIIISGLYIFFIAPLMYVKTTDAVIDGHIINITSRAGGQIVNSYVMKDQEVRKGDLLIEIDAKDYETELIKIQTDIEINKEKLKMLTNAPLPEDLGKENKQVDVAEQTPVSSPPQYIKGSKDFTNYNKTYETQDLAQQNIARKKIILGDAVQNISNDNLLENEVAKPIIDKSKIDISNDTVESVTKLIKTLETQKEEVKLLISATKVFAPQDGTISGISISQGDVVNPSDVLCTIIPKQVWVIARVNPEQLPKIQVGQYAEVKIPGYKYRKFKATVSSVDKTNKVYRIKPEDEITQIDSNGEIIQNNTPAYQIKLNFIEDYSDFSLPPDTEVSAKIKVQSFLK